MTNGALDTALSGGLTKTDHFTKRQQTRGITDQCVLWTVCYGTRFYQGAECVFFLGRKQLRRLQQKEGIAVPPREVDRADGTVVVVGPDNALITTYKNPNYIRHLKRCA